MNKARTTHTTHNKHTHNHTISYCKMNGRYRNNALHQKYTDEQKIHNNNGAKERRRSGPLESDCNSDSETESCQSDDDVSFD